MENGKHGAVARGIEKLVAVPGGGHGAGFGFAVADDAGDDEVGIIECGAEGVGEAVAEFAAFVDGAWGFRRAMAADAAGEGELAEEFAEAFEVLADVGVNLGVGTFHPRIRQGGWRAVAGAGDVNHVEVELTDEAIEMDPEEGLAGIGAPVAEQALFDVFRFERLAQKGIVVKVDHAGAEVVAGAPVFVEVAEFLIAKSFGKSGDGGGHWDLNSSSRISWG